MHLDVRQVKIFLQEASNDLGNRQCVGQEVGPVLLSVGLTQPGQGEGEAGGEQEHRVHHRQPDHQSEAE